MKTLPKSGRTQGDIKVADEYNPIARAGEVLANPLQSIGEYAKYGELPASGFSKNDKNAYDQVIGLINPMYWANAAGNSVDFASEGEYTKAGREALDALPGFAKTVKYIPIAGKALQIGNKTVSAIAPRMTTAVGQARRAAPLKNYFQPSLTSGARQGQKALPIFTGAKTGSGYISGSYRPFMEGGYYQEGGEQDQMGGEMPMPQDQSAGQDAQIQQVMQQVAQMLQQGADPQQVLQQLVQSGVPQDQATQIIQAAMQQSGAEAKMKCGGKMYQEGGEMEEPGENEQVEGENPQQEQIEDQVEQALKQGADPKQVLQQLVQMGMPEEEAIQMIQEILQEMQNGEEQEAPEEEQPMMKNGGNYLEALKGKVIKNYTYNKNTGNYDVEFE